MKKKIILPLVALAMMLSFASCSNSNNESDNEKENNVVETTEQYTIRYMKNDGSNEVYKEETVKMKPSQAYINAAPTSPERDGYRFAGWQTKENVTSSDLIHGVSPYEWRFGKKLSTTGKAKFAEMDEETKASRGISSGQMLIDEAAENNVLTLYARWNEPVHVSTPTELQNMRDDLYGWYVLDNDISLSSINFEPIGAYFCSYEYYETSWWTYAFHGSLDGNGHTISGLNLNKASYEKNYKETDGSLWNDDGAHCNGNAALFSAVSSGKFSNLTLKDFDFDVNYSGDFCYMGALTAFDMGSTLENVEAENISLKLTSTDENQNWRSGIFTVVGGLVGGAWSTTVTDCSLQGDIELNTKNVTTHGGEIYLGGMFGENYSASSNVHSDVNITINHEDVSNNSNDLLLNVNVGGLGGAATGVHPFDANSDNQYSEEEIKNSSSSVKSNINVSVSKPQGQSEVAIGGVGGAKRYDLVQYTDVDSKITLNTTLDNEQGKTYVGEVAGRIDVYYLLQILCYTSTNKAGAQNNTNNVTCNNSKVTTPIDFIPEGLVTISYEGDEVQAIVNGATIAQNYSCEQNINEIIEKYNSYIAKSSMSQGIIIIYNEE